MEFALILPVLLAIFGATLDFARLYQAWIQLQAATRVASEYVAEEDLTLATALVDAKRFVCTQTQSVPGFQRSLLLPPNDVNQCTQPAVTVPSFTRSTTAPGATLENPIGSATVQSTLPFRMFFNYPLLTQNGTWTLRATESYSVVQGR
ncbi:MAG TPA: TadE/TadG family type IV pilus assembly protein [Candidatus Limnocylindrales bacterium]|nr:TadE/TadG family type IV pilus assembly protein [Candidatus Limnocylindrales bacterium]